MSKKILPLEFHDFTEKPKKPGMKFVMFRLEKGSMMIGFEWGFANFENGEFEIITTEGISARVVRWANLPNPANVF